MHHQKSTPHPDPFHVTAHYLRATSVGPFEVLVRTLRVGKGMSNLHADLIQDVRSPPFNLFSLCVLSCVPLHGYSRVSSLIHSDSESSYSKFEKAIAASRPVRPALSL